MDEVPWKPSKGQIAAAAGKTIPDVLATCLDVLFCGINPSLYSAAVGHHFARPGNRFWPALHASGFTERLLSPFEDTLCAWFDQHIAHRQAEFEKRHGAAVMAEIGRRDDLRPLLKLDFGATW